MASNGLHIHMSVRSSAVVHFFPFLHLLHLDLGRREMLRAAQKRVRGNRKSNPSALDDALECIDEVNRLKNSCSS